MLLPAFLVTTLVCFAQADQNVAADVAALLEKFREFNGTADVLNSLERIGEQGRELFRLGYPIAAILKQGVNMTDEESEDAKAMMELRNVFIMEHRYVDEEATYSDTMYTHNMWLRMQYSAYITHSIGEASLKTSMHSLMNTPIIDFNPMSSIAGLDSMTRLSCSTPEKEGIRRLAKTLDTLRIIEKHAYGRSITAGQPDSEWEWNTYKKSHFSSMIIHETDEEVDLLIANVTAIDNATHEIVMEVFTNWTRESSHLNIHSLTMSSCALEETNAGSGYNQTQFLLKIGRWHRDMLRSELLKWVIASVTEPNEKSYYKDMEITTAIVERTAHFIADWTRQYQNISWPEMGIEATKDAFGFDQIPLKAFNETARKVQKLFEESGSQSYAYQVLVVSTSEKDVSWSVGTERVGDYANITNYNGVDIHIFRYDRKESVGRAKVVEREMGYKQEDILKEMKLVSTVNSTETTKNYLAYFQQESASGKLHGENLCNSVILLKNSVPSDSKEAGIPIGLASFDNASYKLETSRTYYPVHDSGKDTVNSFKMFFFM